MGTLETLGLGDLGLGNSGSSGDSALTPESIEQRRRLAEAMLKQGQSEQPIQHWSQGANHVLQSILGSYQLKQLDNEDKAGKKQADSLIANVFGGGATPAAPVTAPAAPVSSAMPRPVPQTTMPSIGSPAAGAQAASGMQEPPAPEIDPADARAFIKAQEGYAPVAKWDVRQNSGGYGSKAAPGEVFTPQKAELYLSRDMQPVNQWLDANVKVPLTPQQRTALLSFGYNLGTDDLDKLLPDINRGDWGAVARRMPSFNNARNAQTGQLEPLDALTTRRQREAALLTQGAPAPTAAAATQPDASAGVVIPPTGAGRLQQQALALMANPRTADLGRQLLIKAATAEAPKQPEAVQEYALAVKQGYNKPFMDYQIEMKQASRPQTNVSVSGDKKGAEEMAKLHAQEYDKIRAGANAARNNLSNLDALEGALSAGVNTGALGETEQSLRKLAQYFGVGNVNKVAAGDLTQAISNRLALAVRSPNAEGGGMPGAMSDADREFLKSTVPGLSRTPEGNRQLIDIARKLGQRSIDMHKMAVRYAQAHDGQLDPGFEADLDAWADANPLFPQVAPKQGGNPAAGAPELREVTRIKTKQEYDALSPGARYIAPDGSPRTKQ
jgi:GH24 family phage-related lysozyme (muramidase)